MKKVASIGVTGGIGSGKSFVCALFALEGIRIYEADTRAKELLEKNPEIVTKVQSLLGAEAYFPDGRANRPFIASKVFSDKDLLTQLNAIIHPATIADFEQWKHNIPENYPWNFQFKEAAILFESGTDKGLDAVVCISAPEEIRIQRVIQRDGLSREQILERIQKQLPEAERISRSDYILVNDGERDIKVQVQDLIIQLQSRFA